MGLSLYLPSLKKSFNGMMIYSADILVMVGLTDKLTGRSDSMIPI
jgi:hypothetical protein